MDFNYIKHRFDTLEEKLQGLIELNNRLILENIRLHNSSQLHNSLKTPNDTSVSYAPNTESVLNVANVAPKLIEIHQHDEDSIKVIGNTYSYRSVLRENGGSWNKNINGWVFENHCLGQLVDSLSEKNILFKTSVENHKNTEPTTFQFMEET